MRTADPTLTTAGTITADPTLTAGTITDGLALATAGTVAAGLILATADAKTSSTDGVTDRGKRGADYSAVG